MGLKHLWSSIIRFWNPVCCPCLLNYVNHPVNLHPLFLFWKHGSDCDPEKNQVQNMRCKKQGAKNWIIVVVVFPVTVPAVPLWECSLCFMVSSICATAVFGQFCWQFWRLFFWLTLDLDTFQSFWLGNQIMYLLCILLSSYFYNFAGYFEILTRYLNVSRIQIRKKLQYDFEHIVILAHRSKQLPYATLL